MLLKICENVIDRAAARLPRCDGGDTVAVWQRQGKTSRIRALTLIGTGFAAPTTRRRLGLQADLGFKMALTVEHVQIGVL
jgi:hypothetical protein